MKPYISEIDLQATHERYNDMIQQARLARLIREAQAAQQPAERPARTGSLVARLLAALLIRRPARA